MYTMWILLALAYATAATTTKSAATASTERSFFDIQTKNQTPIYKAVLTQRGYIQVILYFLYV